MAGELSTGRRLPRFKISFYAPLTDFNITAQAGGIDLNPDVESLTFSTQYDCGFNSINVGYTSWFRFANEAEPRHFGRLTVPIDVAPFAHVEVTEGKNTVAEGRIKLPEKPGGRIRRFQAPGYGVWATKDGVYESDDTTQIMKSGLLLAQILRAEAPTLFIDTPTSFIDPGILHTPSEFDLQSPAEVIQQVLKEGDIHGNQLMFLVYEGRRTMLRPILAPERANYHIDFSDAVDWQEEYEETYSDLVFSYTGGSLSPIRVRNPHFRERYGLTRTKHLSGGTMSDTHAQAFVQSWLQAAAGPQIAATVTIGGAEYGSVEGMPLVGGGTRASWLVRAGEWVDIGDQGMFPIMRTQFDANSLQLTVELGQLAFSWDRLVSQFRTTTRQYGAAVNANTGARN